MINFERLEEAEKSICLLREQHARMEELMVELLQWCALARLHPTIRENPEAKVKFGYYATGTFKGEMKVTADNVSVVIPFEDVPEILAPAGKHGQNCVVAWRHTRNRKRQKRGKDPLTSPHFGVTS